MIKYPTISMHRCNMPDNPPDRVTPQGLIKPTLNFSFVTRNDTVKFATVLATVLVYMRVRNKFGS